MRFQNRKTRQLPFGFAIALLLLLWGCGGGSEPGSDRIDPAEAAPSTVQEEIKIIAFGNSLTAGRGLANPDEDAWPALLEEALIKKGYAVEVVNSGVSGNTTFDALARLDYSIPSDADIVLVEFGANDTFQGKKLDDIQKNLEEIVSRIKKNGPRVLLFEMQTFPSMGVFYAGRFQNIFEDIADDEDVTLVPFFLEGVAANAAMNTPDRIHPNENGHKRIVENILPFVLEAVREIARK